MSDIEQYVSEDENFGLEDFDPTTDATVPRIKIIHNEGVFKDSQSGEKIPVLRAVLLGLVKSRVLWEPSSDLDDAKPLCKSFDAKIGHPDITQDFPWDVSGYDEDAAATDDAGRLLLPCDSCGLKEWGTDPKGKKAPWCTEQHNFPLMYDAGGDVWVPAILTVQKTGISNSKNYCASFHRAKQPLFTAVTTLTLTQERKGTVDFCTPIFEKGEPTDPEEWEGWKHNFLSIASYLRTPPTPRTEETAVAKPAKKAAKAAPARQRAPQPEPVDDEEPPF